MDIFNIINLIENNYRYLIKLLIFFILVGLNYNIMDCYKIEGCSNT
jgi:hypothetical protein